MEKQIIIDGQPTISSNRSAQNSTAGSTRIVGCDEDEDVEASAK